MYKATQDYVIAELGQDDYQEQNGIYMPTKDTQRTFMKRQEKREIGGPGYTNHLRFADVVSVGPKVHDVATGDTIYVNRHNGEEIELNGKKYIAVREMDIAGVIA